MAIFICTLSLPTELFFDYLIYRVGALRPRFEQWRWNVERNLGSDFGKEICDPEIEELSSSICEPESVFEETLQVESELLRYSLAYSTSSRNLYIDRILIHLGLHVSNGTIEQTRLSGIYWGRLTTMERIMQYINRSKERALLIQRKLNEEPEVEHKNAVLIWHFISEFLNSRDRTVFQSIFVQPPRDAQESVSPSLWVGCWGVYTGAVLFICYWTTQW